MLRWTLTFLVLSLIAALFGFTTIAGESMAIARIVFVLFLVMLAISIAYRLVTGKQSSIG